MHLLDRRILVSASQCLFLRVIVAYCDAPFLESVNRVKSILVIYCLITDLNSDELGPRIPLDGGCNWSRRNIKIHTHSD